MNIPNDTLPYILYQRTTLDADTLLYRVTSKANALIPGLYKLSVWIRGLFNRALIKKRFSEALHDEYIHLLPYLPEINNPIIVDIGCGMGGIDVFLNEHYKGSANFYLVDESRIDKNIWYGYEKEGSRYNDLEKTGELLKANALREDHFSYLTPKEFVKKEIQVDIVISLISWGYHYPVATYAAKVKEILKPNGILIIDVRKEVVDEIKSYFSTCTVIFEDSKRCRVLASQK